MRNHIPFMRKINGRQIDFFAADIIPDIKFSPIAYRKRPDVFPFLNLSIIDIPKFRSLPFWIPLTEFITYRKYSLLGPGFLFIPACTTDTGVKSKFFNRVQKSECLKRIAAGEFASRLLQRL